jgi:hypothetical protein
MFEKIALSMDPNPYQSPQAVQQSGISRPPALARLLSAWLFGTTAGTMAGLLAGVGFQLPSQSLIASATFPVLALYVWRSRVLN